MYVRMYVCVCVREGESILDILPAIRGKEIKICRRKERRTTQKPIGEYKRVQFTYAIYFSVIAYKTSTILHITPPRHRNCTKMQLSELVQNHHSTSQLPLHASCRDDHNHPKSLQKAQIKPSVIRRNKTSKKKREHIRTAHSDVVLLHTKESRRHEATTGCLAHIDDQYEEKLLYMKECRCYPLKIFQSG